MTTCGLTRLLALGWIVGLGVSTLAGSSAAGWIAALATLAVVIGVQRHRGGGWACPVPTAPNREHAAPPAADEAPRSPSR